MFPKSDKFEKPNYVDTQNQKKPLEERIFNSKLFFNLDSNFSQSQENSDLSDCETYVDIEDDINNNGCYLNKELIEQLDSPYSFNKIEESNNFFLALVNNGYEYIPKKYQFQQKKIGKNNKLKNNNLAQGQKKTKNVIKERRGDWVCQVCSNVNFAFRTVCNRCRGRKEECLEKIIM